MGVGVEVGKGIAVGVGVGVEVGEGVTVGVGVGDWVISTASASTAGSLAYTLSYIAIPK